MIEYSSFDVSASLSELDEGGCEQENCREDRPVGDSPHGKPHRTDWVILVTVGYPSEDERCWEVAKEVVAESGQGVRCGSAMLGYLIEHHANQWRDNDCPTEEDQPH